MVTKLFLVLLTAAFVSFLGKSSGLGLSCSDHPGFFSGLKSTLPKSWTMLSGPSFGGSNYHVNPPTHQYAPLLDVNSTKYRGLDLFWAYQTGEGDDFIELELQRAAKVYLLVAFEYNGDYPEPSLEGWKSEEYVGLVKGVDEDLPFGVHQTNYRWIPREAYAFSKVVDGKIILPTGEWVQRNIQGGKPIADYIVLVAEEDGSATGVPTSPAGVPDGIEPNARCPDELHDLWMTGNTDDDDADTAGMKWRTWHPMWDPCYWCAYDHEHGSSPKDLMDYEPKFGYVSWKNERERELHAGFKGVVVEEDGKLIYYMMHGQTSNVNRLSVRWHTITLVVKDAKSKETLVEVGHKGDFGFISARKKGGGVVPLQEEDEKMMAEFEEKGMFRQRTVNVINEGNLDPRFSYRDGKDLMRGEYEEWSSNPICSVGGHHGALRMDFTNSISGIKVASDLSEKVELGFESNDRWFRNSGVGRVLRAREFMFAEDLCMFKLADIEGGRSKDGVFYTDARGTKLKAGAGEDAVRQLVKAGVVFKLDGDYEALDSWTGLYKKDHEGRMLDYGYGLDPDVN